MKSDEKTGVGLRNLKNTDFLKRFALNETCFREWHAKKENTHTLYYFICEKYDESELGKFYR